MKLGNTCWILILFSLVIFLGTAGAHPHELGKIDHGPSLESYQIDIDFTTDDPIKSWHDPSIKLVKKEQSENSIKRDKGASAKKMAELEKVRDDKDQKQKEQ